MFLTAASPERKTLFISVFRPFYPDILSLPGHRWIMTFTCPAAIVFLMIQFFAGLLEFEPRLVYLNGFCFRITN